MTFQLPPEPRVTYAGHYTTIEEAEKALEDAAHDVAADFGEEMVEQAWADIVTQSIAPLCTVDVAVELLRRNGFDYQHLLYGRER